MLNVNVIFIPKVLRYRTC